MARFDAIYLVLHGAMVTESMDDVEGEFLDRLRRMVGEQVPIFGVFDLHANFSDRMARLANGLVAYRENPHTDARRAARSRPICSKGAFKRVSYRVWFVLVQILFGRPQGPGPPSSPCDRWRGSRARTESQHPNIWAVSVSAGSPSPTPSTRESALPSRPSVQKRRLSTFCAFSHNMPSHIERRGTLSSLRSKKYFRSASILAGTYRDRGTIGQHWSGRLRRCHGIAAGFLGTSLTNAAITITDSVSVAQLRDHRVGQKRKLAIGGRSYAGDQDRLNWRSNWYAMEAVSLNWWTNRAISHR